MDGNSRNLVPIFVGIFCFGLLLWGTMLLFTWGDASPNALLMDMGKTGASLALITVVGGMVQWIIKNRESELQKEKETLNFYRNMLSDFKSVYDKVERARLLIEAHRTAKTYGEEMRELIGGVVTLHNIKRALNPEFPELSKELKPYIDAMSGFIKELLQEYRDNYKRISILQEVDEAKKKVVIEQTKKEPSPKVEKKDIPTNSWNRIKKLEKLAVLRNDKSYDVYRCKFLTHLDRASAILRSKIPVKGG